MYLPGFLLVCSLLLLQILPQPSTTITNKQTPEKSRWRAIVSLEDNPPPNNYYLLDDHFFIKNGVATVQQEFSQAYRYWTHIVLEMPCNKSLDTDNMQLIWRGKSLLSLGVNESDMGAQLAGEKDTALVNCITYYRPPYSIFRFGTKVLTDVPEVVLNPENWAVYSIQVKNQIMSFTKNGKTLKTLKSNQHLGKLKSILLHFKGSGIIDWVKLYQKEKLVMEENFNQEQKSSVEWY